MTQEEEDALTATEALTVASAKIQLYTSSLFARSVDDQLGRYCGAATLVRVGPSRCLLTAAHVWDGLRRLDEMALPASERRPAICIDVKHLRCLHSSPPPSPGEKWPPSGPDIALLELPPADANRLEDAGNKAFYDLTLRRASMLASDTTPPFGMWVVVGSCSDQVELKDGSGARPRIQVDVQVSGMSCDIERAWTQDPCDYLDASTSTSEFRDYRGLSGSGLWAFGEPKGEGWIWQPDEVSLEGVAFYQNPDNAPDRWNIIRCHGRRSIYGHLLDAVVGPLAP